VSHYKGLLDNLFRLAVIDRWNDHPKPFDITELDKQAHKAIIAYLLAKIEEEESEKRIDWIGLIDGIIFEALQRAVLTDIKPRLFHKLMKTKKKKVNEFVLRQLEYIVKGINKEWYERFKLYLFKDSFLEYEKKIIQAAHFLSTYWEFQFIYNVSKGMYTIEKEKQELENTLEDFHSLLGVQRFLLRKKLYGFINLCGQLRFQKRWIQTVRIPRTSVMGHMLMVAILSYVALKKENITNKKCLYSTFMTSLFHDLPEIITRDIISNLKQELTKGKDIIKEAEIEGVREEIYPLLPEYIRKELSCFLAICEDSKESPDINEFSNRICKFTNIGIEFELLENAEFKKICEYSVGDDYLLIPGKLIKEADIASAYAEAIYSINFGLRSQDLMSDAEKIRERLLSTAFAEIAEVLKVS